MRYWIVVLLFFSSLFGEQNETGCKEQAAFCETTHTLTLNEKVITYKAVVGSFLLKNDDCEPKANIFFTSYTKQDAEPGRPITFCFNGGPGSSSVWLHLGFAGPKKIRLDTDRQASLPYTLENNPYSLLDLTDLVFIDPISTGYSQAIPPKEAKNFHSFEQDIASCGECIRLYLTKFNRWTSPKYLVGESYGTTRAAGLASYLHQEKMIELDGLILISSVLNFQTIDFQNGNDLAYLTVLPSYTSTAFHYKKLSASLQTDLESTLDKVKRFAANEYAAALFKGEALSSEERKSIAHTLSVFTGLSEEFIDKSNLRVEPFQFSKELLRGEGKTLGLYDSSLIGTDECSLGRYPEYEPSLFALAGAFTACLNAYMQNDLEWKTERPYNILTLLPSWDFSCANQYLNVSKPLRDTMRENTHLKVFVASGYLDLVTPFFATDYTFSHLNLPPSLNAHVTLRNYEGGHMMYIWPGTLAKMKADLTQFYKGSSSTP